MHKRSFPILLILALLAAPALAAAETVVARVGDHVITQADLDLQFDLFLRQSTGGAALSDEARAQLAPLKKQYLQRMVQDAVVVQAAERLGLAPDEATIDRRVEQAKQRLSGEAAFLAALKQYGIPDVATYRRMTYDAMAYKAMIGWIRQRLRISEAATRMLYLLDREAYAEPEQICTAHILVPSREEAEDVIARLKGGADFAELAREVSQDPGSAPRGGDLGCVALGRFVPEFERAALALQPGQVSEPVQTQFGWHVIRMNDRRPARVLPYEEVRGQIRAKIEGLAIERFVKNLVAHADAEVYPDRVQ
ncbi:PpiC-type peptidyl-prolyl cis-trans isomerase [Oceanithermus profundus DSM 14977]|uniref:PpiC-type peptidyl-prolyl cis-trans isomerase n=1 Tax=Oceanithermus profundus (strain DSM 14977 / NBRC 100410 / VKM B-2274 / 506) TaxID=670487 RepID=E4U883_OCEP5|nr:peptidylprolyl isomerase [Oceanithermus profundus]ADR36298.1 PpiC-type peptidyl-prolyl cis-trans isomerase [Oceanithermus profundus DSM 14977]